MSYSRILLAQLCCKTCHTSQPELTVNDGQAVSAVAISAAAKCRCLTYFLHLPLPCQLCIVDVQEVVSLLRGLPPNTADVTSLQSAVVGWCQRWPSVQQPSADACLTLINVRQLLLSALSKEWRHHQHQGQSMHQVSSGSFTAFALVFWCWEGEEEVIRQLSTEACATVCADALGNRFLHMMYDMVLAAHNSVYKNMNMGQSATRFQCVG